jgi:heme/copper-type cytochrome/quinol oxidase subunit 4
MQTMTHPDEQRRRKNMRTAWILAGFVLLIMLSSIPFWQGLLHIALNN